MYTLEQLEQKNIKQLKEIRHQLNVVPASDRRCRQNWIDAIVNVNSPLLQLLEASPAASLEQVQPIIETVETPFAVEVEPLQTLPIESKSGCIVYPRLAQKSIPQAAENSPGVESVDPIHSRPTQKAQEYKFFLCLKDGDNTLWYDGKDFVFEKWSAKTYCKRGVERPNTNSEPIQKLSEYFVPWVMFFKWSKTPPVLSRLKFKSRSRSQKQPKLPLVLSASPSPIGTIFPVLRVSPTLI